MIWIVSNSKGGVGKTTTAVSVAHGLAVLGIPTLLVDLDPQGHVAAALGMQRTGGVHAVMAKGGSLADHVAPSGRTNLDVLPGDKSTAGVKIALSTEAAIAGAQGAPDRTRYRLADVLEPARQVYGAIVVDCGPTLDILNINAMHAGDRFLLPVKCDYLAVDGLAQYVESLQRQLAASAREVAGRVVIVPTLHEGRTRESRRWLADLTQFGQGFGAPVADPVPAETDVREATSAGRTVFEAAEGRPRSCTRSAEAYGLLLGRVLMAEQAEQVMA